MNEPIELDNAMVIVRTADRTYVFSAVNGTFQLDMNIEEGAEHGEVGALWTKDVDRIRDYNLQVTGLTPGYIHVPNMFDPTTIKKEG